MRKENVNIRSYHNDKLRYYFLIYNSLVLLVQIRDQFNFNKQNKRHNIFFKAKLLHKVLSITSGGFFQEKTTHIAQCTTYGSACNGQNVVYKSCFKKHITPVIVFIEVELTSDLYQKNLLIKLSIIPGNSVYIRYYFFIMAFVILSFFVEQGCLQLKYFLSRINRSYEKGSSITITSYNHDISKFFYLVQRPDA